MQKNFFLFLLLISNFLYSQNFVTPFEQSKGKATATYFEAISFYKQLAKNNRAITIKEMGITDAGYPLHLVLYTKDKSEVKNWEKKLVILINNGIHPGEPDGIDASMLFLRDIVAGKINVDPNVALAIIPVYNIGGCLNRNSFSRVNQQGPESYGFRGNAQNLDLNRDFIKADSKEAKVFASIYHLVNPAIFIDNHVSDGADYQHTMTLLTTQQSKLGGAIGDYLHTVFEPSIYKGMNDRNWKLCPYVNFETANPDKGWQAFYDGPRYSSGYTSLFATMGFVPETHMLKPFADRVYSTYALMQTIVEQAGKQAITIQQKRKESIEAIKNQQQYALNFIVDTTQFDTIEYLGYQSENIKSEVTNLDRLYYNHLKPYTKSINFYNYYKADNIVTKPQAYIIPQGWGDVIERLKLNKVQFKRLLKDSTITVQAYKIVDYKTSSRAYEKHYKHSDIKVATVQQTINFLKGDYIIFTGQKADRFLVETLEPTAEDSYFAWNFFDAILQQKEGYSNYRWEDVAAKYLKENPTLQQKLNEKKKAEPTFSANANAQLDFVYKNSPYYEPAHLRYPIYRIN